jgi:hypothetical protein
MALQSSGQIKLSEIATEFGGSAPHALSEYYGDGNAPASGEIQLAADFYGTSNAFSTTLSWATRVQKVGNEVLGFTTSSSSLNGSTIGGGTMPSSLGSIAAQPSGPNIAHLFRTCSLVGADDLNLEFVSTFTSWTSITIGSKTFTRASATTPGGYTAGITNRSFQWRNASNGVNTYITDDNGNNDVELDPFGSGSATGTPSGTVTITLNI